ncbi:glycoside hydrolase [Coprinellus micaceus]|uniref:glucan endo-1,3-beta-D-glucosidase n=1 Tax=Coprinellus micaceus TaxID=71717 RepID=A0A4Y7T8Y4_COPMI|nr:glycoside hydrolase [Coprinellus micaceus]
MAAALEDEKRKKRKSKLIIIGAIIAVIVLAAVGTAVGVIVSKNNSNSSSSSSKSTKNGSSTATTSDPNNPSKFTKDPALHQAFYGMAYTPEGALMEFGCSNTLENTIRDIQLLSQLTKRVRLYGADCNQTAQVLEAIVQTKVEMEVFVGIYNMASDDHEAYQRQRDLIKDAIETYGTKHIAGVTVGNEFMLNWVTGHDEKDPNSAIGKEGSAILLADIQDMRKTLDDMSLDKHIPLSNVHAWFANTTAEGAADWVFEFFDGQNVAPAALLPNKPHMYIAETGWPTKSSDAGNAHNGGSPASEEGLQSFLDTFLCQANDKGVGYFFFEMFDEEWKDIKFGGVEGWWGLFNKDRTLKNVKIPTCTAP